MQRAERERAAAVSMVEALEEDMKSTRNMLEMAEAQRTEAEQ